MIDTTRSNSVAAESAVLVGVLLPTRIERANLAEDNPLEELSGLAATAGVNVVGELTQRREIPDVGTYLGKGKLEELRQMVEANDADCVIFDNDLSPAQIRTLEQTTKVKVLDRTELILDIFASRAQTYEARLAVELAQLQYSLPRLKRMWTHLSRIKAGVGMRGPGEKQLEVDRRLVEKRIHDLSDELKTIHKRKERLVRSRDERMTVSLVGYTNAGKSTLMNAMTDARVLAENRLFATLDTRTRKWQLPGWGPVLLSDTVGFIRDLPHSLIASFKATLEEAHQADLLLHVADASNPAVFEQIAAVYAVLEELDIQEKDTLLVLNKVDHPAAAANIDRLRSRYPRGIEISARTGQGLAKLSAEVAAALSQDFAEVDVEAAVGNGKLMAYLAAHGEVLSQTYSEDRVVIHCRIARSHLGRIAGELVTVTPHLNGHQNSALEQSDGHGHYDSVNGHAATNGTNGEHKYPPLPGFEQADDLGGLSGPSDSTPRWVNRQPR